MEPGIGTKCTDLMQKHVGKGLFCQLLMHKKNWPDAHADAIYSR